MARTRITMEVGGDGVALITISHPPVNALAPAVSAGLKKKHAEAMRRDDVKAIVITGDAGKFSGGFDINVFADVHKTGDMSLLSDDTAENLANLIEDGKKPSVAAIQGLALGGGLELAMGCHARISTPDAQLGLPELTLGIIPGSGGTQRLPRLVGLPKAIEMMLLSKFIGAKEGKEYGLIDAVVSSEELIAVSRQWALDIAGKRKPWISSLHRTDRLALLSESREILKGARDQAKRIAPNMPQHQACLDAIEEGVLFGGYAGFLKEVQIFRELVSSSTSKALVYNFFSQRLVSKIPNVTDIGIRPRPIKKVAVIGGGLMGSGIATSLILNNIPVILKEIDSNFLRKGMDTVAENIEGLVKKGSLTKDKKNKVLSLIKGVLDYSDFIHVDMVIEAVIENLPLKQSIFAELERTCSPQCILATNTSTIALNLIGKETNSQDRIIGAHFFSPAHVMPLLEIVRTERTSPQVIIDLMTVGKIIKKVPIVVGNCTGFAVNRTFFPYYQSAAMLVHLGVDLFRIDRVISAFGMPMGPFLLQDLAGFGVAVATRGVYSAAFRGRTFESGFISLLVENGRNGKANGKGCYIHEKGSKPRPDPSVQAIVEESRRRSNIMPNGKPINVSDRDILEMIFFPAVNEACRVFDERILIRASDLDIACVLGMGFPKYRGGLIFWADSLGASYIYSRLKKWEEAYGSFFAPSSYLEERAKNGLPLSMIDPPPSEASRSRM